MQPISPTRHDILVNGTVFLIGLGSLFVLSRFMDGETLRKWVEAAGVWAPLAFVAAKTATIVIAPLSGGFLYPLAGASFGLWYGVALSALGDAIGSTIAFGISRRFGKPLAEKFLGNESNLLVQVLAMMGTVRGFFITRVIFITAHDLLAYAAGLTKLPFLPFIIIQGGLGLIPAFLLTGFGSALFEENGTASFGLLFALMMGIGVISSLAFAAYTYFNTPKEARPEEGAL